MTAIHLEDFPGAVAAFERLLAEPKAAALLAREVAWVQQAAREQVPAPFSASLLERNPVNRALLAGAAQRRLAAG